MINLGKYKKIVCFVCFHNVIWGWKTLRIASLCLRASNFAHVEKPVMAPKDTKHNFWLLPSTQPLWIDRDAKLWMINNKKAKTTTKFFCDGSLSSLHPSLWDSAFYPLPVVFRILWTTNYVIGLLEFTKPLASPDCLSSPENRKAAATDGIFIGWDVGSRLWGGEHCW